MVKLVISRNHTLVILQGWRVKGPAAGVGGDIINSKRMKNSYCERNGGLRTLVGFLILTPSIIWINSLAYCPITDCDKDCGTKGNGCQITQYDENGKLCSTTICHGKRGDVE
jgi:hypothetical protein